MKCLLLIVFFLVGLGVFGRPAWAGPNEDLIEAAHIGHLARVRTALRAGADVNATNKYGFTALLAAALNGQANVIPLLLKAGANVNAKDKRGDTALL